MTFNIEPEVVFEGLLHLHFDTQYEITSTFLRLQEYYESDYPEIRGKHFTLDQYMDRYAADKGNFTYTSDWSGFNVPGHIIEEFAHKFAEDLLEKEKDLLGVILQAVEEQEWAKYYVIASSRDGGRHNSSNDVMRHEIAHGMYYLNDKYRKEMRALTKDIKEKQPDIAKALKEMGYCNEVVDDEIQAYFGTSNMTFLADDIFEGQDIPWELVLKAQRTFERFNEELTEEEDD